MIEYMDNLDVNLPYLKYHSDNNKKCVVMFHGLSEHIERYTEIGEFLFSKGINVYMLEYRGHGLLREKEIVDFGVDFKVVEEDIEKLLIPLKEKYKDDLYLFGHSFGTNVCLKIAIKHGIKNIILTAFPIADKFSINIALLIAKFEKKIGIQNASLNKIFDVYNFKYRKEGKFAWLNRDKKEVQKYIEDKNCGFLLTPTFYIDMFSIMKEIKRDITKISENLNLLVLIGSDDPVVSKSKIKKYLRKIKSDKREMKLVVIENARHELLKEINKDKIFDKILKRINGE